MASAVQKDDLLGTRFAELAQVTAARKELSEFGKCCALFIAATAMAVENGYPLADLDALLAKTRAAVMATAGQVVVEGPHNDPSN